MERDIIRCPVCGKPMQVHTKYSSFSGFGDDPDYVDYTFVDCHCRCKDCKVSFITTKHYFEFNDLYNLNNWKLPKDFKPTITEKQRKCIYAISKTLNILPDPCFTLESAAKWISDHMQKSKDMVADNLHDEDVEKILYAYGYNCFKDFRKIYDSKTYQSVPTKYYNLYTMAYQQIKWNREAKQLQIDICLEAKDFNLKFKLSGDPKTGITFPSISLDIIKQMSKEVKSIITDINNIKQYKTQDVDLYLEDKRKNKQCFYQADFDDEDCLYDFSDLC